MGVVIVEEEGAVLGVNSERPIATIALFPNYVEEDLFVF